MLKGSCITPTSYEVVAQRVERVKGAAEVPQGVLDARAVRLSRRCATAVSATNAAIAPRHQKTSTARCAPPLRGPRTLRGAKASTPRWHFQQHFLAKTKAM